MKMPWPEHRSLWALTAVAGALSHRFLDDGQSRVHLGALFHGSTFDVPPERVRGRSVMIATGSQLHAALALLQLDGIAARVVLCPADVATEHLPAVVDDAQVDVVVDDGTGLGAGLAASLPVVACGLQLLENSQGLWSDHRDRDVRTEWILLTSGTTGRPKLVVHDLPSLTGPLSGGPPPTDRPIWSTFYDIRRYGGLQILLRALAGGGSMVLSQVDEPPAMFLARAGRSGVTHISGTPTHWRLALMSAGALQIKPRYVRLSGEVADQPVLANLAVIYPGAKIVHAFASTEAGLAFEVEDELAGFPASMIGQAEAKADLRVVNGSLQIRSSRVASRYLGDHGALTDEDGFVDTGDLVELRSDRYYFVGRRQGVINVGGKKVYPEEVEAAIIQHPAVRMTRVYARLSPIMGALVTADIVVQPDICPDSHEVIKAEIIETCRTALQAHKVPAMLHVVPNLDIAASGKLARRHA